MEFNASKCKVIYFRHNNPKFTYKIKSKLQEKKREGMDSGVTMHSNLELVGIKSEQTYKLTTAFTFTKNIYTTK